LGREVSVRKRAIEIYSQSVSFDQANRAATKLIIPLSEYLTQEEIQVIVEAGFGNNQITYSHEFLPTLMVLRVSGAVTQQWWDSLLRQFDKGGGHNEALFQLTEGESAANETTST
jgi:hypothetical protein